MNMIKEQIHSTLHGGDILLIVPPFVSVQTPLLGVHLLQSVAKEHGFRMEILYLNMALASIIGVDVSERLVFPPPELYWQMLHERLFARSAYGLPPLGKSPEACLNDLTCYQELEKVCYRFVEEAVEAVIALNYRMIGCSQMVGQTNCAIALLNGIKRLRPETITLTGGASCLHDMARGIASLSQAVDYIFSGESDVSFGAFLQDYSLGRLPAERIIQGTPLIDLDNLSLADYSAFFEQIDVFLGERAPKQLAINYETSRGCWWGAETPCHFCSERHLFRAKTVPKVLSDLKEISRRYPGRIILTSDLNMPRSYYQELLPELMAEKDGLKMSYMTKTDIGLQDLINLKKAHVFRITSGPEVFSDEFLKLINKGVTLRHNLLFLRNARAVGMHVDWLLLWGFPGDKAAWYQETLEMLPLIRHLQPPVSLSPFTLVRFSPYFERAQEFQIKNIRPWPVYSMIYPEKADIENLAYWHDGEYPCEAFEHPQLIEAIAKEVDRWKQTWETTHLMLVPFQEYYLIMDNRGIRAGKQEVLESLKAQALMTTAPYTASEHQQWALEEKLAVLADNWYVPLVTAAPEVLLRFEELY